MSLTKITNRVIEPNTITANSLAEGISLGGGGGVTIDQIIVTDETFANTEDTQVPISGGYLKLYGSGFEANANVYISNTFFAATQVTANVISSNEIRLTIGGTNIDTYNLFLINENASTATKLNAIVTYLVQPTEGWFGGGQGPGSLVSTVNRIDFAADTGTASVRGPLSLARAGLRATGTISLGWFGGGASTVDRITFSADTDTASVRGPLDASITGLEAVGDDTYGWFGGGEPFRSTVVRITFSADTNTVSTRGPLGEPVSYMAATDNNTFGWFGAGRVPTAISTVYRITFSNDTGTAPVRGALSYNRPYLAATGNDNYGWFGGGSPGPGTTVDRIDYANDNTTASVRGSLAIGRYLMSATGNQDYGWFGAGFTSQMDRITFAADTATASIRGNFNEIMTNHASTSGAA